jgi:hypothetical protein
MQAHGVFSANVSYEMFQDDQDDLNKNMGEKDGPTIAKMQDDLYKNMGKKDHLTIAKTQDYVHRCLGCA